MLTKLGVQNSLLVMVCTELFAGFKHVNKGFDDLRIKLSARAADKLIDRFFYRRCFLIAAAGNSNGVIGIKR